MSRCYSYKGWTDFIQSSSSWDNSQGEEETKKTKAEDNADNKPKRRGRPKGSKNRKTLEREAVLAVQSPVQKRGRGRPKGSKNKKALERVAAEAASGKQIKRRPGRPKGSKTKKTLERESSLAKQ